VREGDPGDGGRLEGAPFGAAVTAFAGAGAGWDLPPGQVLELGVQAGPVVLTVRM
jgi:hypothetical protein